MVNLFQDKNPAAKENLLAKAFLRQSQLTAQINIGLKNAFVLIRVLKIFFKATTTLSRQWKIKTARVFKTKNEREFEMPPKIIKDFWGRFSNHCYKVF